MKSTELSNLVNEALQSPTRDDFNTRLHEAGYVLDIRRHNPVLVPNDGGRHTWLHRLDLNRQFWVAYSRWPDGIEAWLQTAGPNALKLLWHGLSGYSCGHAQRRTMDEIASRRGILSTAQTMCSAAESAGDIPAGVLFRRFTSACRSGAQKLGRGPAPCDDLGRNATIETTAVTGIPSSTSSSGPNPQNSEPYAGHDTSIHVGAILPQGSDGSDGSAAPTAESLAQTVDVALTKPLYSCFYSWMLGAGYEVRLQGGNAVFVPVSGGPSVSSESLGVAREFWLRMVEWPDAFTLDHADGGLQSLAELWAGLFGCPPGREEIDALRRLLLHLHLPAVIHAAYDTAVHQPSASAQHRLAYFQAVAWRMVHQQQKNLSPNEQRAAALSVPAGMRPRYRWTGRAVRGSGMAEVLPSFTSARPGTTPAAGHGGDYRTMDKTCGAAWAAASSGHKQ